MRQKTSLYKGLKVRSLMFTEQGVNAGSGTDQATLNKQAAGVAYFWKKFSRLPSLEAVQYHRRVDNSTVFPVYFGLWTDSPTSTLPEKQGVKKRSWNVWQAAGTATETTGFSFALPIIGVNNWEQTFNPLVGEVNLCKVDFNLTSQASSKNNLFIYFNGERHKTQTAGAATFYNVASLSSSRSYQIKNGTQLLWPATETTIGADKTINVNLDPVGSLTATPQSSTSIKVDWQDITNFEKGYVLEYKSTDQSDFTKLADISANTTSYVNEGLPTGKTYQYRLYAFNDTVKTLYSKVVEAKIDLSTAIGDDIANNISIYPNPSEGDLYVCIADKSIRKFNFKLFELSGQQILNIEVKSSSDSNNKITISPKPIHGVYIAQISYNGSSYRLKVSMK